MSHYLRAKVKLEMGFAELGTTTDQPKPHVGLVLLGLVTALHTARVMFPLYQKFQEPHLRTDLCTQSVPFLLGAS